MENVRIDGNSPDVVIKNGMVQPKKGGMSTWDDMSNIGPGNTVGSTRLMHRLLKESGSSKIKLQKVIGVGKLWNL